MLSRLAKETNAQARQMFEQAIALDPQYAEAYTGLGWTYCWELVFDGVRTPRPWSVRRNWRAKPLPSMTHCLGPTVS